METTDLWKRDINNWHVLESRRFIKLWECSQSAQYQNVTYYGGVVVANTVHFYIFPIRIIGWTSGKGTGVNTEIGLCQSPGAWVFNKTHVKIHISSEGFSSTASDWLAAVLPANQMPGLNIPEWFSLFVCLYLETRYRIFIKIITQGMSNNKGKLKWYNHPTGLPLVKLSIAANIFYALLVFRNAIFHINHHFLWDMYVSQEIHKLPK